jgi:hypothetical protein
VGSPNSVLHLLWLLLPRSAYTQQLLFFLVLDDGSVVLILHLPADLAEQMHFGVWLQNELQTGSEAGLKLFEAKKLIFSILKCSSPLRGLFFCKKK